MPNKHILFKNSTTPWECFKDTKSNLVYFVHSKCACTFYKQLFSKLNWKKFVSVDIDWNTHVVFSHIRDPLTKHRTGIIEWFYYNNKIDLLYKNSENSNFFTMLSEIAYLDTHSLSIYEHLGENSKLVSWIPIDQPGVDHVQQTFNLIEQQHSIDNTVKQLSQMVKVTSFTFIPIHTFVPSKQGLGFGIDGVNTTQGSQRYIALENAQGNNYNEGSLFDGTTLAPLISNTNFTNFV